MTEKPPSRSTSVPRRLTWAFLKVFAFLVYGFFVLRVFTPYLISAHDDLDLALAVLLFATLPITLIWLVWSLISSSRRFASTGRLRRFDR